MAGSYPVTMALAMGVLLVSSAAGLPLTLASYAASGVAAILVTWHEAKLPYRREWHPSVGEVRSDATFMAAFHMLMPYLLGLAVTFWLVDWLEANNRAVDGLWPHGLPIVVQVVLMLLIIDFVRYWIHWSLHRFVPLWGFHAVHHSERIADSDNNYGNVLIVWDLIFGTWYLPPDRSVDSLGLINRDYPMGLPAQMRTPFIRGLDKRPPSARRAAASSAETFP